MLTKALRLKLKQQLFITGLAAFLHFLLPLGAYANYSSMLKAVQTSRNCYIKWGFSIHGWWHKGVEMDWATICKE